MGCVPDRTLARYKTFQNEDLNHNGQLSHISHNSHLSINSGDPNISNRPFGKVYRSCTKRSTNTPVKSGQQQKGKRKPNYFSLQKTQWNNMEEELITKKQRTKQNENDCRTKGAIIEIPHREHVITSIQTPSQSARSSYLSKLSKNPSNFFVSNNENDLDTIFRSKLIEKVEESTMSVNNFSPQEITAVKENSE